MRKDYRDVVIYDAGVGVRPGNSDCTGNKGS